MQGAETVTVVRPAPLDKFGDPIPGETDSEFDSDGWLVAPGGSAELRDQQNSVDSDMALYRVGSPTGEDIQPKDRVRVRGKLYEVQGEPAVWRLGTVINLRKFTG
jgi:hypothetical protein